MKMSQSKNKKFIFIAVAAVLAMAAVLLFLLFRRGADAYRSIKVIEMEGIVGVERKAGESVAAAVNMNLVSGDKVTTGEQSYAVLQLDKDKYVMLGANGAMQVVAEGDESAGKTSIELESGSVLNEIQNPLSEGSSYDINTPNATMSVRGTVFEVRKNAAEESIDVLVYDGAVSVGLDGQEPVLYGEGEYTSFEDKENPQFLTEHGVITDEVMDSLVAERLEKISAEGRNINAGEAKLSGISEQETNEVAANTKENKESAADEGTEKVTETASETNDSQKKQPTVTTGSSQKSKSANVGTKTASKTSGDDKTVSSQSTENTGSGSSNNNSNGNNYTPQPPAAPANTEKPGDKKPKDSEKPSDNKPKDSQKPDDKKPKDSEKPGDNKPNSTEKPDDNKPADSQAPVTNDSQTPSTQTPATESVPVPSDSQEPSPQPPTTDTQAPSDTQTPPTETPSDTENPGDGSWFKFNVVYYLPYIAQTTVDAQTGAQTAEVQYQWQQWYAENNVYLGSLLTEPATKPESINSPGWNGTQAPEGLVFAGWYLKGSTRMWNFASDRVVSGREFYASWKDPVDGKMYYPVVFEEVYSSTSYVNCIKEGSTVNLIPQKEGYKFCYWRTASGNQWDGIVRGADSLTPVWEKL